MKTATLRIAPAALAGALLPLTASAEIVYTDIPDLLGPGSIDINADGVHDLEFTLDFEVSLVQGLAGTGVFGADIDAYPVWDGQLVGPDLIVPGTGLEFLDIAARLAYVEPSEDPKQGGYVITWPESGYLGLQIPIDGQNHYAWARIESSYDFVAVFDFAYETTPGMPIAPGAVPAPGTLAALALGGAAAARRKTR